MEGGVLPAPEVPHTTVVFHALTSFCRPGVPAPGRRFCHLGFPSWHYRLYHILTLISIRISHNILTLILCTMYIDANRYLAYNRLCWESRPLYIPVPRSDNNLSGPTAAAPILTAAPALCHHPMTHGSRLEGMELLPAYRAAVPPPPGDLLHHALTTIFKGLVRQMCATRWRPLFLCNLLCRKTTIFKGKAAIYAVTSYNVHFPSMCLS